jgi:glutaminyl-peptide cyclotransferase
MALAASLAKTDVPRGNLALVWTDGEECQERYAANDGLWGSRRAVDDFRRRGLKIRAVLCLDMLGDRDLTVSIPANGDESLAALAVDCARRAGLGRRFVRRVTDLVTDDHVPFLAAGVPAIDLIDFDYGRSPGANDYWHTPHDTLDKISVDSLHKAGRLVTEMLTTLL